MGPLHVFKMASLEVTWMPVLAHVESKNLIDKSTTQFYQGRLTALYYRTNTTVSTCNNEIMKFMRNEVCATSVS